MIKSKLVDDQSFRDCFRSLLDTKFEPQLYFSNGPMLMVYQDGHTKVGLIQIALPLWPIEVGNNVVNPQVVTFCSNEVIVVMAHWRN